MGVYLKPVDFDRYRAESPRTPIIVNDLDTNYQDDYQLLARHLLTNYSGPTFSMEPVCDCGHLKGGSRINRICPECGTKVLPHTEKAIYPELWLRVPEGIHAFISPYCFSVLDDYFSNTKVRVIRWLIDVNYNAEEYEDIPIIRHLIDNNVKRGLNNFYENFDSIMDVLLNFKVFSSKVKRKEVHAFIEETRMVLFTQYLPIPNKIVFVTEKSATGKFAEMSKIGSAIDAVNSITSLKTRIVAPNQQVRENVAVKVILNLSSFYEIQIRESHGKKPGWWRKHIFGMRMPFTSRAVITSLSGIHDYDEIHLPWGLSVASLKLHLENKLYKKGFTPNEAKDRISRAVQVYDPLIDQLLKELISESPYTTSVTGKRGIPYVLNRNPSLLFGSLQIFYITKIDTDVSNPTISFSPLAFRPFNSDLDGDALNGMVVQDAYQFKSLQRLALHGSIFDMNKPWGVVHKGITITKELASTIANYLDSSPIERVH